MKKYFLLVFIIFFSIELNALSLQLRSGWNAIGTNSEMTLDDIKSQLGSHMQMIQNPSGTKTYNYRLPASVHQSFANFEIGVGYWIKVDSDVTLDYQEKQLSGDINIDLSEGWNLIDPLSDMTLDDIKSQLGEKLLMIQNPSGSKTYNYRLPASVHQSFINFEPGVGYWIKVSQDTTLTFSLNSILSKIAVDGTLNKSTIDVDNYVVKVLTDQNDPSGTSQNLIVYFKVNGVDKQIGINSAYAIGSKFQLVAYDTDSNVVYVGNIHTLDSDIKASLAIVTNENITFGGSTNTGFSYDMLSGVTVYSVNESDYSDILRVDYSNTDHSRGTSFNTFDINNPIYKNYTITNGVVNVDGIIEITLLEQTTDYLRVEIKRLSDNSTHTRRAYFDRQKAEEYAGISNSGSSDNPPSPDTGDNDDITPPSTPNI